jgi:hypothetical protein
VTAFKAYMEKTVVIGDESVEGIKTTRAIQVA